MANLLYPIFLKLDKVRVLIVGGGNVALEKLEFLYKSSPNAVVRLLAPDIKPEITAFHAKMNLALHLKTFDNKDFGDEQIIIIATENKLLNEQIHAEAKQRGLLVNVADTPDLCDFYLGSIVTKGDLKIAISTNGKSPTFAKRFRELLEEALPEQLDDLLTNLQNFRNRLTGDFNTKVKQLNELTRVLLN